MTQPPGSAPEPGKSFQVGRLRLQLPAVSPENRKSSKAERAFDPRSWSGALIIMIGITAILYIVEIVDAASSHHLDRYGMHPRTLQGLQGIVTMPFLHSTWWHLVSNPPTFLVLGWVVLLSGLRGWLTVTGLVMLLGGAATWVVAPSGLILGASS